MRTRLASFLMLTLWTSTAWSQSAPGLKVPAGFDVVEFADSKLANDIICMTIDPRGRVIVSGRGYIRILVDEDGDGRADKAVDFARAPADGAMGLWWEGKELYFTGAGGLRRFRDDNDDGQADGPSELIRSMTTGGEHAAHAVRRGPDGWLYVLCGNNTNIDASYAQLPTSPIKKPIAGCVLRFTPDLSKSEIVAHGFRNPYAMDFNADGELFTFDSDNERCVSLPWYEPTRFYHVIPGGFYGWLSPQRAQFWRMPPYFLDVIAPVATLGRGSPTGVVCYRHGQFPEEYRGGFFLCDWTFGKVHFVQPKRHGTTYTGEPRVFLEATGDNGFAPVACAVCPRTGDLYVAIGGRGTRGAVYRIRHAKGFRTNLEEPAKTWTPATRTLSWEAGLSEKILAKIHGGDDLARLQGLLLLERFADRFTPEQRRDAVAKLLDTRDRPLRQVLARLLTGLPAEQARTLAGAAKRAPANQTVALGLLHHDPRAALQCLQDGEKNYGPDDWLDCIRLYQMLLGELVARKAQGTIWEGYTVENARKDLVPSFRAVLLKDFPGGSPALQREKARLWALGADVPGWNVPEAKERLAPLGKDPVDDIHYLAVLARLPDKDRVGAADVLVTLDRRIDANKGQRDSNWPLRVFELYQELAQKDPKLQQTLLAHAEFGRPEHVLFTAAPGFPRKQAARIFLAKIDKDADYPVSAALVDLLGQLAEEEIRPTLLRLWGQAGLEGNILALLGRRPLEVDRAKFVAGLASPHLETVTTALTALAKLPRKKEPEEIVGLIRALGNLPDKEQKTADAIVARLREVTGQDFERGKKIWQTWFQKTYPELGGRLANPDGVDTAKWAKRLAAISWDQGLLEPGRKVFAKASCVNCHSGSQALGPDLAGVTGRFSRDDLFTAILQPSWDVPARYQTKLIETHAGKIYQGVVIYDAVDGLILQTATGTVRIAGRNIAGRRVSPLSLMPSGLLDALSDGEIADLYAYLRSLGKQAKP